MFPQYSLNNDYQFYRMTNGQKAQLKTLSVFIIDFTFDGCIAKYNILY